MDFKPCVSLSPTRGTPPSTATATTTQSQVKQLKPTLSSPSSTGSFPIRAPLTIDDDDDSDFEPNGQEILVHSDGTGNTSVGSDSGSESDGFVTGEESETASERPFLADLDEEIVEESEDVDTLEVSRPFLVDPDKDFSDISDEDEVESCSGVAEEGLVVELDNRVRPIAQLSMEDDEFHESLSDEEMVSEVEDGGFSGLVKVPTVGVLAGAASAPRLKVLGDDGDTEVESLMGRDVSIDDNSDAVNTSLGDSTSVELDEDKGVIDVREYHAEPSTESEDNSLVKSLTADEDVKNIVEVTVDAENFMDFQSAESGQFYVSGRATVGQGSDSDKLERPESNFRDEMFNTLTASRVEYMDIVMEGSETEETMHLGKGKLLSNEEVEGLIFGSSAATEQVMNELEQGLDSSSLSDSKHSQGHSPRIDGVVGTDSGEEMLHTVRDGEAMELYDSAALAALVKAATGAESGGGSFTFTASDGSRVFSLSSPASPGSSFRSVRPAAPQNVVDDVFEESLSEEEKKKLEKIQAMKVKFLRLVYRLGHSPDDSMVAQVLYRLALASGTLSSQAFNLESSKRVAMQLEEDGGDDSDFSLNILVLGKTGVGKSATINSIFGEGKAKMDAFEPGTVTVKEIIGTLDGVKVRVLDTPGLKSPLTEQGANRKIFASVKKFMKKFPPNVVLYVDRLDTHTRDVDDLPLLKSLTDSLSLSIWQNAIVTLTHAASGPPDGPSGSPISYEVFVARRSRIVQQSIGQAVGDLRLSSPSMMHPIALVENHPSCQKNQNGESVLPNGQSWRSKLLLLCYSLKILQESNSISEPHDPFDYKKLFGLQLRSPPLPYFLSSLLQSQAHPKLSADEGGDGFSSDIDLDDLLDSNHEEEDEYDQLPPFKPLKKSQVDKLTKEQSKAYFEEYDYRVKLLQKKQLREEVRLLKEMKKRGENGRNNFNHLEEDGDEEGGNPASLSVPLPDMILPPSFDSDNPVYRYRQLEPMSQILVRPVLDSQGWDHDCGYDGVNIERNFAIAGCFPGAFAVQITKDKKDFNIHLDSSLCAKHGENGSTMAALDIQTVGRQLAYILRGETKFKKFKTNKTTAGVSVTLLGKTLAAGAKIGDQITLGKRVVLMANTGAMHSQGETAYGANVEVRIRDKDFPIGQDDTLLGLSLMNWRGDLGLMANIQSQLSIGRDSKVAIHAGLNKQHRGQVAIKISSSEQLQTALIGIVPLAISIFRSIYHASGGKNSLY